MLELAEKVDLSLSLFGRLYVFVAREAARTYGVLARASALSKGTLGLLTHLLVNV